MLRSPARVSGLAPGLILEAHPHVPPSPDAVSDEAPDLPVYRISKVEDRERLLAEAMAHAEAQEAQYQVLPAGEPLRGRWKAPAAWAVFGLAAVVALFPPGWLVGRPSPTPTDGDWDRGVRAAVYLQAQQVEAFRLREGRLPDSLDELPAQMRGVTFVKSNNRVYQLRARRPDGSLVVYDSAIPAASFQAAAGWIGEGGTR